MKFSFVIFAIFASALSANALSQVDAAALEPDGSDANYQLLTVTDGITIPWGMVWLNDSELLVTDRTGTLHLIQDGKLVEQAISGVPEVDARNQGGLLDVEKHPDYANNGWLYLSYSGFEGEGENGGSHTSVIRAKLDKQKMALTNVEVIFDASPNTDKNRHFGSRLEFDKQGHLYISVGDRGERDINPQRLDRDAGKIHRIMDDGSIPRDNPFVNDKNANASIFSYGHRNPQGMARHPSTGDIWTHEHGPKGGDEINLIEKGNNYGWPVISYGINYNGTSFTDITAKQGMVQPKWQWTPSIAPSAMQFVDSAKYPEWNGHMLVGSLKFAHVVLVKMQGNKVTGHAKLFEGTGRIRSISQSPSGDLYLGVEGRGILRIASK